MRITFTYQNIEYEFVGTYGAVLKSKQEKYQKEGDTRVICDQLFYIYMICNKKVSWLPYLGDKEISLMDWIKSFKEKIIEGVY